MTHKDCWIINEKLLNFDIFPLVIFFNLCESARLISKRNVVNVINSFIVLVNCDVAKENRFFVLFECRNSTEQKPFSLMFEIFEQRVWGCRRREYVVTSLIKIKPYCQINWKRNARRNGVHSRKFIYNYSEAEN